MFTTLIHTALVVFFAARYVVAAELQFFTPELTQCQDATLTYSGGQGSYGIYVVPSEDPCADSVVDIPEQTGTSYKWKVNIPAGSKVELLLEDSTGAEAWSGVVTVKGSSDASCVDPKAAQALNAANSASVAATVASGSPQTASTTLALPTITGSSPAYGTARTVQPAAPSGSAGIANAANTHQNSGSVSRAVLPAGSLLGVAILLIAMVHL